MSHKVMLSILEELEAQKQEILNSIRGKSAPSHFNTLMRALPRLLENDTPDAGAYSDVEVARMIGRPHRVLGCTTDPRQALAELKTILSTGRNTRPQTP